MRNKKLFITIITILIIGIIGLVSYFVIFKEDKKTTLTLLEKQWIENNKTKLIDMSIMNEVPLLTYNGEGIFFDFLTDLEDDTKLEFNKVAIDSNNNTTSDYSLTLVDQVSDKQLLIYRDNYALLTVNNTKYNSLSEINNITVGVLKSDLESVDSYLNVNSNLLFKSYDNVDAMIKDLTESETKVVDAIVLPKLANFKKIAENSKLNIAYNISEMTKDYVLQLGNDNNLNNILTKYYKKWKKDSYDKSYQLQFSNAYLTFANIDDKEKVEFKSKRYTYGFVQNSPYDYIEDGTYVGINHMFMADFANFANIEISYKKYNDIDSMVKDFNENKLDIIFNNTTYLTFEMDVANTISTYDEKIAIVVKPNNEVAINSVNSLKGKEVMAIKSTKLADYLSKMGVNVKAYNNIKDLINNVDKNSIVALDYDAYTYYSSRGLSNYKVVNTFNLDSDYNFTVRSVSDNSLFAKFLNFYLSYADDKAIANNGYYEVMALTNKPFSIRKLVLSIIGVISAGILIVILVNVFKPKKKKVKKLNLSKEDKLKYVDMLTSLKNRTYLNDNIERWDASEAYPQTIIIMDLNNVAYINDNYGHAEGDKVIGEAANILIATQMPNTDIIRTNGNEFLIYMVGYDEKQVVAYIRKLNKELKSLSHSFGAAIGYSMINDAIKTVDDAINEATTAMKEVKEETIY